MHEPNCPVMSFWYYCLISSGPKVVNQLGSSWRETFWMIFKPIRLLIFQTCKTRAASGQKATILPYRVPDLLEMLGRWMLWRQAANFQRIHLINRHCACNRTALILYHKLTSRKEKGLNCDVMWRPKVERGWAFDTYLALKILLILRTSVTRIY